MDTVHEASCKTAMDFYIKGQLLFESADFHPLVNLKRFGHVILIVLPFTCNGFTELCRQLA